MDTQTIVARWTLGLFRGEDLPEAATALLLAGHDNQLVRELAGLHRPTRRDAGDLFDRAMQTAGFIPLPHDTAVRVAALDTARRMAAGTQEPYAGAGELEALWSGNEGVDRLFDFYALTDAYGQSDDDPVAREALRAEMIALARQFLREQDETAP